MTDMVHVPVPVERLQEVYEVLGRAPARQPVGRQVGEDGYPDGWSPALMDRMFVESSSAMRRILGAIAQGSPKWVTIGEIAGVSGLTARQVVASLGPFEKRVRGRYGMSEWPFAAREFVDVGILKYSMSPEVANRISELILRADEHERGPE